MTHNFSCRHWLYSIAVLIGFCLSASAQTWGSEIIIAQKLAEVPVFLLADEHGAFLTLQSAGKDPTAKEITVFLTPADANNFLTKLKAANPAVSRKTTVTKSTAAEVYRRQRQDKTVTWRYIAAAAQLAAAQELLAPEEKAKPQPDGVPLFAARTTKGYLTITQNGQRLIPLFFDKAQLQATLEELRPYNPLLAFAADVKVLRFESVIEGFATRAELNPATIVFIPLPEALAEPPPPAQPPSPVRPGRPAKKP